MDGWCFRVGNFLGSNGRLHRHVAQISTRALHFPEQDSIQSLHLTVWRLLLIIWMTNATSVRSKVEPATMGRHILHRRFSSSASPSSAAASPSATSLQVSGSSFISFCVPSTTS